MKRSTKNRVGLTILDVILAVLIVAAVLSTIFSGQIRSFLKEEETVRIRYEFVIKNPSAETGSIPKIGDEMIERNSGLVMGTITGYVFDPVRNNATCTVEADAVLEGEEIKTYKVSGLAIKDGEPYDVRTDSYASFTFHITNVEEIADE